VTNLGCYPGICLETEENHEKPSDRITGPQAGNSEYETGMLTTRPRRSVLFAKKTTKSLKGPGWGSKDLPCSEKWPVD
jgi:hypothetical protein